MLNPLYSTFQASKVQRARISLDCEPLYHYSRGKEVASFVRNLLFISLSLELQMRLHMSAMLIQDKFLMKIGILSGNWVYIKQRLYFPMSASFM